jgi:hypothetical protein
MTWGGELESVEISDSAILPVVLSCVNKVSINPIIQDPYISHTLPITPILMYYQGTQVNMNVYHHMSPFSCRSLSVEKRKPKV